MVMDKVLLIIAIFVLVADIISNVFFCYFGEVVFKEREHETEEKLQRARMLMEILDKAGYNDIPPDELGVEE